MMGRNRRGIRQASLKARLGIAAVVLAGGGAIGAVAVAASSHSAPATAQSAGYTLNFRHPISQQQALSSALSTWATSQQKSLATLARMAPVKNFATVRKGRTTFAVQRGVVALATKHWLLIKSSNGSLHLWLLNGKTQVKNVANNATGTAAMTGSTAATTGGDAAGQHGPGRGGHGGDRERHGDERHAQAGYVHGLGRRNQRDAHHHGHPDDRHGQPTTMTAAQTMAAQTGTAMTMAPARQPVFAATKHIARGDLVLVTGVVKNHFLWAQLVLFSAPNDGHSHPDRHGDSHREAHRHRDAHRHHDAHHASHRHVGAADVYRPARLTVPSGVPGTLQAKPRWNPGHSAGFHRGFALCVRHAR